MSRPSPAERERGSASSPRKSGGPGAFALMIVAVFLLGAVAIFLATNREPVKAEPESTAAPASPFADLPPEAPREKQATPKGKQPKEPAAGAGKE